MEDIRKLQEEGKSIREIAIILGIGRDKVHRILKGVLNNDDVESDSQEIGQSDSIKEVTMTESDTKQDTMTEETDTLIQKDHIKSDRKISIEGYYDTDGVYRLPNGRTIGEDIFIFD